MIAKEQKRIELKPDRRGRTYCCIPLELTAGDMAEVAEQVKLLNALADSTRLQIVFILSKLDEPLCVCDITSQFSLGQPTISHHLKVLRDAGLVTTEKRGLWVYYSLDRDRLGEVTGYLSNLLTK